MPAPLTPADLPRFPIPTDLALTPSPTRLASAVTGQAIPGRPASLSIGKGHNAQSCSSNLTNAQGAFRCSFKRLKAATGKATVTVKFPGDAPFDTNYDYAAAIGPETALLLKVHTSNYRVVGFTAEVSSRELVEIGRERGIPVIHVWFVVEAGAPGLTHLDLGGDLFCHAAVRRKSPAELAPRDRHLR